MKLFSKLLKKEEKIYSDNDIVALADAQIIPVSEVNDEMFAQEMLGQTIAFQLLDHTVVAPCNGKLEVLYPTGHAFAIRMNNGRGILVHIGINTVDLKGHGFKVYAKQGDNVKAGQKILDVDLSFIKEKGYDSTTMLIITEPLENEKLNFMDQGTVKRGQIINL